MIQFVVFVLGLIVGSFLNVCIHRLPRKISIVLPRSHCPHCQEQLRWWQNIPIISFILLRGKCHFCRASISWRYPLLEVVSGVAFLFFYSQFGFNYLFLLWTVLFCVLLVASIIDASYHIIQNNLLITAAIFGITIHSVFNLSELPHYLIAGLIGSSLILIMAGIGQLLFRQQSMGGGDIKLMAVVGLFVGIPALLFILALAVCCGAIWGVTGILLSMFNRHKKLAFAPFVAVGSMIYFIATFLFSVHLCSLFF